MLVAGLGTRTRSRTSSASSPSSSATVNVVGGFVVTDRMLEMFKKREPPKEDDGAGRD